MEFNRIIVHGGNFHADDVLCVWYATTHLHIQKWERRVPTEDELNDPTVLVADVGMSFSPEKGNFDHHVWRGGPCSFQAILEYFESHLLEDDMFLAFVKSVSEQDTCGITNWFSQAVKPFNPNWDEGQDYDACFERALEFATTAMERMTERIYSAQRAEQAVKSCPEICPGIISSDVYMPFDGYVDENINFVIFPSNRGGWNIKAIQGRDVKLPSEWQEYPPMGMTFIHKALFMASFESREQAEAAAKSL